MSNWTDLTRMNIKVMYKEAEELARENIKMEMRMKSYKIGGFIWNRLSRKVARNELKIERLFDGIHSQKELLRES